MDYSSEYLKLNPTMHLEDADEKARELLFQIRKKDHGGDVLDIGCGAGAVTSRLAKVIKPKKITGIDISPAMISSAKKINKSLKAEWIVGDIFKFESKFIKKYDLIICADIVEHLHDDIKFFNKLGNLGKVIIIKIPLEDSFFNRIALFFNYNEWARTEKQYGHIHHYGMVELEQKIRKTKLEIEDYTLFPIAKKRSNLLNELGRQIGKFIGIFSKTSQIRFAGGFVVFRLTSK